VTVTFSITVGTNQLFINQKML